jgi:HSP20 family protein
MKGKYNMSTIRKFDKNTLHALHRDEFLTPFDRIFDEFFAANVPSFSQDFGVDFFEKGSYPKVNIIDFSDKIVIEAEVPGLDKSDVNVEVESNVLTILGNKAVNVERDSNQTGTYLRRELKRSSFRRSFTLGENISKETIDAKFENGILLITLHKIKPNKPEVKKITVK